MREGNTTTTSNMVEDKVPNVAAKEGENCKWADTNVSIQVAAKISWSTRACGSHWTLLGTEFDEKEA